MDLPIEHDRDECHTNFRCLWTPELYLSKIMTFLSSQGPQVAASHLPVSQLLFKKAPSHVMTGPIQLVNVAVAARSSVTEIFSSSAMILWMPSYKMVAWPRVDIWVDVKLEILTGQVDSEELKAMTCKRRLSPFSTSRDTDPADVPKNPPATDAMAVMLFELS